MHFKLESTISSGYRLDFQILQTQKGTPFELDVPYAVWRQDTTEPHYDSVRVTQSQEKFYLSLSSAPRAILLDPLHEVFRRLESGEVPPSISKTYGDRNARVVFSKIESSSLKSAYREFASTLNNVAMDESEKWLEQTENSVWLLGRRIDKNKKLMAWLAARGVTLTQNKITLDGKHYSLDEHSVVLTLPHPESPARSITWVMLHSADATKGLARKLPHYGKYGYLVFKGTAPTNVAKGIWSANPAGRLHRFADGPLPLPRQKPLVDFRPGDPLQ